VTPTLLGAPYDASSSYQRGAAGAPPRIRAALGSPAGNPWCEDLRDLSRPGAYDDAGDLVLLPDESARFEIERGVAALLDEGRRPLVLGGDHSITWPVLRAVRRRHPRLSVLHLDAHPDLYDEFDGDRASHACPFARAMEEGLADQLVQAGIRATTGHQAEQASRFGVETLDMRAWSAGQRFILRHPVYISIDLDALDPAFAPGVSHREPGGLSVREVLSLIQGISLPIVGADLVEYNPDADVGELTAGVAAKLVKEVLAAMLRSG
jgi:agmatinase